MREGGGSLGPALVGGQGEGPCPLTGTSEEISSLEMQPEALKGCQEKSVFARDLRGGKEREGDSDLWLSLPPPQPPSPLGPDGGCCDSQETNLLAGEQRQALHSPQNDQESMDKVWLWYPYVPILEAQVCPIMWSVVTSVSHPHFQL